MNNRNFHANHISFIDLLFNLILLFVLLFFAAVLLMNPPAKKNQVPADASMIIQMTWPDDNPNDIDLWLKTPEGDLIGYPNRENSYLSLDRDDLGATNNYLTVDGQRKTLPTRREVISFRGKSEGRYVVNVNFYAAKDMNGIILPQATAPVPVKVELIQINPVYKVLETKIIMLTTVHEEKTAFSFIIQNGEITDIQDDINEPFIGNYSSLVPR